MSDSEMNFGRNKSKHFTFPNHTDPDGFYRSVGPSLLEARLRYYSFTPRIFKMDLHRQFEIL